MPTTLMALACVCTTTALLAALLKAHHIVELPVLAAWRAQAALVAVGLLLMTCSVYLTHAEREAYRDPAPAPSTPAP